MSTMYVANSTSQNHDFHYRLPENPGLIRVPIRAGAQIALKNLGPNDVDAILEQHEPYGLIEAKAVSRNRKFSGLCYQIDREVNLDTIRALFSRNQDVLVERGKELRTAAAVAIHENLQQQAFEQQMPDPLRALETTIEEINRDPRDESPEINEGVRVAVDNTPGASPTPPSRGRRGRRAA